MKGVLTYLKFNFVIFGCWNNEAIMITGIEAALKACNEDKFVNLARLYLAYKYHPIQTYYKIN